MSEFLYIIRGGDDITTTKSPEEMEQHMQEWRTWMGNLANNNQLVGGQPLMNEAKTLIDDGTKVIDRPLAEGKELVGGYLIVNAENLQEATDLAKDCPGFEHHCSIEVREIAPM